MKIEMTFTIRGESKRLTCRGGRLGGDPELVARVERQAAAEHVELTALGVQQMVSLCRRACGAPVDISGPPARRAPRPGPEIAPRQLLVP